MPGVAAVELDRVSKRYVLEHRTGGLKESLIARVRRPRASRDVLWALREVSLGIERNETLAVIGPNGCGKSTLLQIVAGILVPDDGRAVVRGRVTSLLELGAGFSPDLTGRENIFLNASLHGLSRAAVAPRLDAIVAFAELERFIDMPVRTYSSGMYMRLGIAVAVHLDPEIILVDEAFAVGDEAFQRKCLRKLREFQNAGLTIVVVSHDLMLVERMATRACLLQRGSLAAIGEPAEVISRYHQIAAAEGGVAGEYRWGSRDVVISRVEVAAADGSPETVFRTGDTLRVVMHVDAPHRVERPVFGVGVWHETGALLTGPNTRMSGFPVDGVEGPGRVVFEVPALSLLPGRYWLSVSAYDFDLVTPYDHRERVATFTVVEGGTLERFGYFTLGGRWEVTPADVPVPHS